MKTPQGPLGDTSHLDEVFVSFQGQQPYLCRAVNRDGDVIDILVNRRRKRRASGRFFRHSSTAKAGNSVDSSLISSKAMMPRIEQSCRLSRIYPRLTRIIVRKSRINPRDNENIICGDFPRQHKLKSSCRCMGSPSISFALVVISCR